uniref:Uncharacterized protein n=1 Tax=Janibacter limosus TaxID=53458 RepID=A0AC61U609_9MICO|nr:MFS transporter [Janibacter limosus]
MSASARARPWVRSSRRTCRAARPGAGLGGTAQTLGGALAAIVIARIMAAKGRRPGLVTGYAMAIAGGLLIVGAAVVGSFALLLPGFLLFGGATAANSQARFAATDLADDVHKGRHLSIVVWATTIGAVAGPNLTGPGRWVAQQLHLPVLVGPYVLSLVGILPGRARPDARPAPRPAPHGPGPCRSSTSSRGRTTPHRPRDGRPSTRGPTRSPACWPWLWATPSWSR